MVYLNHRVNTKKQKLLSYKQFLKQAQKSADNTDIELIEILLHKVKPLLNTHMPFAPVVFGIDYQTHKYLFWKNNHNEFGGYPTDFYLNEGHRGVVNMVTPSHLNVVSDKIFPETLEALRLTLPSHSIVSSFNYKGKTIDGKDFNAYQKCTYVLSKQTGLPLYCVGIVMDITSFKKDNFISHTIESLNTENNKIQLLSEFTYNPDPEVSFTPKETLVIHYLLDGYSSKQIADKLHISINTVHNHRQNILKKASCSNVAQLMAFVLKDNLKSF